MTRAKVIHGGVLVLLAMGLTLTDGLVHGYLTYRWREPPDEISEAVQKLKELPHEFGDWQLESSKPLEDYVIDILQCAGSTNRSYVNRRTGQRVSVTIVLGPFGPIAVHTPEVCYTHRNHTLIDDRQQVSVQSEHMPDDQFWAVTLKSNDLNGRSLRVFYGWSDGGPWSAPELPRLHYGGRPYLYKIQVAAYPPLSADGGADELDDPCVKFLESFLPATRSCLVRRKA
jgi:hypothetical protein